MKIPPKALLWSIPKGKLKVTNELPLQVGDVFYFTRHRYGGENLFCRIAKNPVTLFFKTDQQMIFRFSKAKDMAALQSTNRTRKGFPKRQIQVSSKAYGEKLPLCGRKPRIAYDQF